ncbi:reductase, partial [Streptomyces sp. MCAF7]
VRAPVMAAASVSGPSVPGPFGLESAPPPVLAEHERRYLTGFLTGIPSGAPGVPVLPPDAPFSPEHVLWVNGVLAGMYSRASKASRAEATASSRRQVVILWASQTGNAEEFANAAAQRLTADGHLASLLPMEQADPAALPH